LTAQAGVPGVRIGLADIAPSTEMSLSSGR